MSSVKDMKEKAVYRGPSVTRKQGSRIWRERVGVREDDGSELLDGVGPFDLHGPATRFGEWMRKQGGTGAGPDVTYEHRPARDYDGGGPLHVSQTYDEDELAGASDLFGQPDGPPRREFADLIHETDHGDPGYLFVDDYFTNDASPTVDLDDGRTPVREPRKDSTFARRKF